MNYENCSSSWLKCHLYMVCCLLFQFFFRLKLNVMPHSPVCYFLSYLYELSYDKGCTWNWNSWNDRKFVRNFSIVTWRPRSRHFRASPPGVPKWWSSDHPPLILYSVSSSKVMISKSVPFMLLPLPSAGWKVWKFRRVDVSLFPMELKMSPGFYCSGLDVPIADTWLGWV